MFQVPGLRLHSKKISGNKMMKVILLCSFFLLIAGTSFGAKKDKDKEYKEQCLAAREYITTVGFLREHKDFALNEKQIRTLADKVSLGCTDASKRFVLVTKLLVKTGLDSKSALQLASKLSAKTKKEIKTFTYIFKRSYLKEFLDLDIKTSIDIAYKLADKFDGNHGNSQRTFNQVLRLCNHRGELDMPNRACAQLAARVAKSGEDFKRPLGDGFKKLFKYLTQRKGPNLATFKAIKIAEDVMKNGPKSSQNFIKAYQFAIAKKGLNVSRDQSISFAQKIALRTVKQVETNSVK
jgi:hypothetical protein